ncbi:MAG: tRNA (adenosine(37)-N6)-threonylcarbamoyltransferase complex dimerization subunit type 1 TsaB [Flavobacteriales bacterium]
MPVILAIETATKLCSVALLRDGQALAVRELESEKHIHAEKVNVFIDEALREASVTMKDLQAVAVGIGPGSYTGLRIGLSAAKGLCFALDIPIIGLSTLGTLWQQARQLGSMPEAEHVAHPMIDARRMEVFTQAFAPDGAALSAVHPLILDTHWPAANELQHVVFGDGADKAAALWAGNSAIVHLAGVRPTAAAMGAESTRRFLAKEFDDLAYLVPTYGKAANVTQPKKRSQ